MEHEEIQIDETGPDFFLASLETYLSSSTYHDVALICEDGRQFHAHKAVLASISPFLKQILLDDAFAEHKDEFGTGVTLHMPHVSFEELSLFLQLAYTGRTNGNSKPGDEGSNRRSVLNLLQTLEVTEDILEFEGSLEDDEIMSPLVTKDQASSFLDTPNSTISNCNQLDLSSHSSHLTKLPKKSSPLGSVSLVKVENPKPKEKQKISASIITKNIVPSLPNFSSSVLTKRNKMKNTNVHVEFAPTTLKASHANTAMQFTTSPNKPNLVLNQLLHPISNVLQQSQSERKELISAAQSLISPTTPPIGGGAIDQHGFIHDKELADKKTREILDRSNQDNANGGYMMDVDTMRLGNANNVRGRKQERCQCPNCMDPNRDPDERRAASLHSCHYADCGKKYKKTSHLRAHLRWHVGDQPFMCSWKNCGKRFTRSDELHRHFRIHTGEKNHQCSVCEKCFARSDHLKKHMLSHGSALNVMHLSAGAGNKMM